MDNLYRVHMQNRTRPDLEQIQFTLRSAIDELNKAYILIDGLDEVGDVNLQETFVEGVKELLLVCNTTKAKLHVLVTSRQRDRFLDSPSISVEGSEEEIASMIEQRINLPRSFRPSLRATIAKSEELQNTVRDMIVSKANGMFLIADMHMVSLSNVTNIRDLREALRRLPDQLDEYYERAWARITSQEYPLEEIAHHTISWLLLSRRQLGVDELRHALAVRKGDESFNEESLIAIEEVLEMCKGLVIFEEHGRHVRLMHSTTLEFFQKQSDRLFKDSAAYVAETCLTYLCLDIFQGKHCSYSDPETVDLHAKPGEIVKRWDILSYRLLEYPFLDYAAEHWGYHVQGDLEWTFLAVVTSFLYSSCPLKNAHMVHPQVFHPLERRPFLGHFIDLFPVRIAISFGLEQIAWCLITASPPGTRFLEPDDRQLVKQHWILSLLEAIENGLLSVTEALLDAGIDSSPGEELPLTVRDRTFLFPDKLPKTALDKSVFYGHDNIADKLIAKDKGTSITTKTMEYAIYAENTKLLGQYLDTTSDYAERCDKANQILHFATINGKLESVEYSINCCALIEYRDDWSDYTALGLAVARGHSGVVKYLLVSGASTSVELEVYDKENYKSYAQSLLQEAVISQHRLTKRLDLIDAHIVVYQTGDLTDTATAEFQKRLIAWLNIEPRPLRLLRNLDFMAAFRDDSDHETIINILLDHGADVSVRGQYGESLLHAAVISTPRLNALLQHIKRQGIAVPSINDRDHYGRTPLHHAGVALNADAMELLIQHGADAKAMDNHGLTTLHFAVNSPACIAVALSHGCKADVIHPHLGTPLQFYRQVELQYSRSGDVLKQAMKEMTESEGSQPESEPDKQDLWDTECEECKDLRWWMSTKIDEYTILCDSNIERYLHSLHQQGDSEQLAGQDAEAKTRPRTWILAD